MSGYVPRIHPGDIQNMIADYKTLPNGEWRNKVISHLKDAYAASKLIEHRPILAEELAAQCTCPIGGVRTDCPVH